MIKVPIYKYLRKRVWYSGASSSAVAHGSGFEIVTKLVTKMASWHRELHNYEDVLEKFGYSYFRSSGEKPQVGLKVINLTETESLGSKTVVK